LTDENNDKLKSLLLKATENAEFRKNFLADPAKMAEKSGVTLKPDQVNKIVKVGKFIDAANELKIWPGPIYYPIDSILRNWQLNSVETLIGTSPMPMPMETANTLAGPVYTVNVGSAGWLYIYASGKIHFVPNAYFVDLGRVLAGKGIRS